MNFSFKEVCALALIVVAFSSYGSAERNPQSIVDDIAGEWNQLAGLGERLSALAETIGGLGGQDMQRGLAYEYGRVAGEFTRVTHELDVWAQAELDKQEIGSIRRSCRALR